MVLQKKLIKAAHLHAPLFAQDYAPPVSFVMI